MEQVVEFKQKKKSFKVINKRKLKVTKTKKNTRKENCKSVSDKPKTYK